MKNETRKPCGSGEKERVFLKKKNGITLIALIITIIIMIILVGVSIGLVIKGDLLSSAEKATNGTNAKVEQEQSRVDELMQRLNTEVGKGSVKYNTSRMLDLQEGIMLCKTANETSGVKDIYSALNSVNELTHAATNETNTDGDRKALLSEIQELSKNIDRIRNNNQYKGEYLLNGKFARSIGANGMYLNIDDLSALALEINNADISSTEKAEKYLEKVEKAIDTVCDNMNRINNVQMVLERLLIMYDEQNQIINSGIANADIEITVHSLSTMEEILNRCIQCANIAYGESTGEKENLKEEMQYWLKGIDVIYDNAEYDGNRLLDGTFKGVSEINTTTLGGGTGLNVDLTNDASIASTISKLQSAIQTIEREISKLGKTSVTKDIGKDREIGAMKDAISLCQTAEGAISETVSILDRIKSILGNNSLTEDNIKEIGQLVEELTRISLTTQFNKENLLDGTFARDIGKNGIYLEIIDCRGEALGLYSSTLEIDLSTTAGKEAYITKVENAITKLTKQKNDIENVQAQLEKLVNEA